VDGVDALIEEDPVLGARSAVNRVGGGAIELFYVDGVVALVTL
jgi:hypothetical protein